MPVWISWKAACAEEPATPAEPVALLSTVPLAGVLMRRITRLSIFAGTLLSVTTRGREMILPLRLVSSAVRRAASEFVPSSEPSRTS